MPRRKSLLTIIRDLVQQEVRSAFQTLLGTISPGKTKPKNGRRRRRRRRVLVGRGDQRTRRREA